jgi:glycosyltransferase involved in cell wall biosynthesis
MPIPCKGDLVTHSGLQEFAQKDMKNILKQGWNYISWVNGIMPNIFKRHDIVILPYGNTFKQHAKSPNRIVDALRSGMIVVTNDTPVVDAYGLRDFCIINNDISDGIEFVWDNPDKAIEKVKMGQKYIEANLSPDIIAGQWAEVIRQC